MSRNKRKNTPTLFDDLISDQSSDETSESEFCAIKKPADIEQAAPSSVSINPLDERYLTVNEVAARYGMSRSAVWRNARINPKFPKPHKLAKGTTRWRLSELIAHEEYCSQLARGPE